MHLQQAIKYRTKFLKSIADLFYIKGRKTSYIAQNKQYKALREESYKYQRSANEKKNKTVKLGIAQLLKSRIALLSVQFYDSLDYQYVSYFHIKLNWKSDFPAIHNSV